LTGDNEAQKKDFWRFLRLVFFYQRVGLLARKGLVMIIFSRNDLDGLNSSLIFNGEVFSVTDRKSYESERDATCPVYPFIH